MYTWTGRAYTQVGHGCCDSVSLQSGGGASQPVVRAVGTRALPPAAPLPASLSPVRHSAALPFSQCSRVGQRIMALQGSIHAQTVLYSQLLSCRESPRTTAGAATGRYASTEEKRGWRRETEEREYKREYAAEGGSGGQTDRGGVTLNTGQTTAHSFSCRVFSGEQHRREGRPAGQLAQRAHTHRVSWPAHAESFLSASVPSSSSCKGRRRPTLLCYMLGTHSDTLPPKHPMAIS